MYRFFDKHGKKVLAVAASLLMVAFLLPTTGPNGCFNPRQQHGKILGQDVSPNDIARARSHFDATQSLVLPGPFRSTVASQLLDPSPFDPRVTRALARDPLTFYLLLREAREAGIQPNSEFVNFIIEQGKPLLIRDPERRDQDLPFNEINPAVQEQLKNSIGQLTMIVEYFQRSLRTVKISDPLVDQYLAQQLQQVRARVVAFDAKDFQEKVPPITDAQLEEHFNAYRRVAGGVARADNPFKFGYLIPDRARFQYIAVPDDEVEKAVIAKRTAKEWDEDARVHYLKNIAKYTVPADDKASDATTRPTTNPSTKPSTQPRTQSFEEVSERVYRDLRAPLIDTLRKTVVNRITQQMTADYQRAAGKSPAPTTQQVAELKVGENALGSTEYLLHIRDDIADALKVTVTVVNDAGLVSETELQKRPDLGRANLVERTASGETMTGAASYLFHSIKPLVPQDKHAETTLLQLFQPSKPLSGGGATYVVRAVAAEPARPPENLSDPKLKEQVENDVRRKLAFQMAVDAAQAALKQAEASSLTSVAGVQETDWLSADADVIPGLSEAMTAYSGALVTPVFDLLRGVGSRDALPVRSVIRLEASDKVVVAELFDVRTRLTPDVMASRRDEARNALARQMASPLLNDWFSPEAVAKRVGYEAPQRVESDSSKPDAPPPPRTPFMP